MQKTKAQPQTQALKERVPLGLTKKQKSPYQLQYLDFQRRLDSRKKCRFPSIGRKYGRQVFGEMNGEQYLALAKELKENKEQKVFTQNKENENDES